MTNEEAKFILTAYRAGGQDASDPAVVEAMRQAQRDPQLGAWFARDKAHATAMTGKLHEVAPPPGLRGAILAGVRLSGREDLPTDRRIAAAAWVTAAAAAAILIGVLSIRIERGQAELNRLTSLAIEDALAGGHGGRGADVADLRAVLADPSVHLANGVPVDFDRLRETGCRTIHLAGHDIFEICFSRDGNWFHLYALQRADFPNLPAASGTESGVRDGLGYVTWADGGHQFFIVSAAGTTAVRQLL